MYRLLSKDPMIAKSSANMLRDHLVTLREHQMSKFEEACIGDNTLMEQISIIADDRSPACIWRKNGRTAYLFQFLADRFLGAPDSVGESESVHALWQKLENNRTRMKLPLLNAVLKLRSYYFHFGGMPSFSELLPSISDMEEALNMIYEQARSRSLTLWRDSPFFERFNVSPTVAGGIVNADTTKPDAPDSSADTAWGNYVRFLFQKHEVYSITVHGATKYMYVAENKSVAYRDGPADGDAIGRAISTIWLEQLNSDSDVDADLMPNQHIFQPVSGDGALEIADMSLAEISMHMGFFPAHATDTHTDRDVEIMHESAFLDHDVKRLEADRLISGSQAAMTTWQFVVDVSSGLDIEEWTQDHRDLGDNTKMSMARQLQLRDGLTPQARNRIWQLPRNVLLAALGHAPAAAAAKAVAKAAGVPAAVAGAVAGGPAVRGGRGKGAAAPRARGGRGRAGRKGGGPGGRGRGRGGGGGAPPIAGPPADSDSDS